VGGIGRWAGGWKEDRKRRTEALIGSWPCMM
jgi:hypothetical protein